MSLKVLVSGKGPLLGGQFSQNQEVQSESKNTKILSRDEKIKIVAQFLWPIIFLILVVENRSFYVG